jgi:molybdopterin converting factor small subunit
LRIRVQALGGLSSSDLVTELEVMEDSKVSEVIPPFRAQFKETPFLLYLVNGKRVGEDETLYEGDSLVIFPPVMGG